MEQQQNPIARLLSSSKAIVVLGVAALSFLGLYLGKIQFAEVESFLKYVLITWLGAQGVEDAAKHLSTPKANAAANALVADAAASAVAAAVKASLPPPPATGGEDGGGKG